MVDYIDLVEEDSLNMKNVGNIAPEHMRIFGYLHTETDKVLIVIKEYDVNEECMQAMVIPKSCVKKVTELVKK